MDVVGIVAEFNPFHDGHAYLIDEIKRKYPNSILVSVMSGNFVQRGEPALYDKWYRSRIAIENGIDLVVQLPTRFSNASSYFFAYGSVEILSSLGVNLIAFGSESGDLNKLSDIADILFDNEDQLKKFAALRAKEGVSFPRARDEFLKDRLKCSDLLTEHGTAEDFLLSPNDILAVDYLLSSKSIGYDGGFFVVKREGLEHNLSASILRDDYYLNHPDLLKSLGDTFFKMLAVKMSDQAYSRNSNLNLNYDAELYNKLKKGWRRAKNIHDVENMLVSKMHTRARARRFLISLLIGLDTPTSSDCCGGNIIYPLAFNQKGATYLKSTKKTSKSKLEFLDGIKNNYFNLYGADRSIVEVEIRSTDFYNVLMSNDLYDNCELVRRPQFIEMQ